MYYRVLEAFIDEHNAGIRAWQLKQYQTVISWDGKQSKAFMDVKRIVFAQYTRPVFLVYLRLHGPLYGGHQQYVSGGPIFV